MHPIYLTAFCVAWLIAIYLLNCGISREFLAISWRRLITYVLTMGALGLFGEVIFDWCYTYFLGKPLWEYHLLPIHSGFTSLYSLFLWGMVGFHLYFLHSTLRKWNMTSTNRLAMIFCLEAIALEACVNISYKSLFGGYIYYYLPGDLWHITSLQTLPLYLLAGYITVICMKSANNLPRWSWAGNTLVLSMLIFVK